MSLICDIGTKYPEPAILSQDAFWQTQSGGAFFSLPSGPDRKGGLAMALRNDGPLRAGMPDHNRNLNRNEGVSTTPIAQGIVT